MRDMEMAPTLPRRRPGKPPSSQTTRGSRGFSVGNLLQLISILGFLALWQFSGLFLNKLLISTPLDVAESFVHIVLTGLLVSAFFKSMLEMFLGFCISLALGCTAGVLMGRYVSIEAALDPFVNLANATPTIALLPLMEIWFGMGFSARISFIVVISVWTLLINTLAGIKNVQRGYRDVGVSFGLKESALTMKVLIPAALPYIFAGMRVGLAQSAIGMILSGQEIGESGLGGLAQNYGSLFQTGHLIAAIVASTGLAMISFALLKLLQRRIAPWILETAASQR